MKDLGSLTRNGAVPLVVKALGPPGKSRFKVVMFFLQNFFPMDV